MANERPDRTQVSDERPDRMREDVISQINRFFTNGEVSRHTVLYMSENFPNILETLSEHSPTKNKHYIGTLGFTGTQELLNYSHSLLSSHGYPIVSLNTITEENYSDNVYIEYHVYDSDEKDGTIQCVFDEHCDDFGGVNFRVHTCIFYLENTFETGGDLVVYTEEANSTDYVFKRETIDTRKLFAVLMTGNKYHYVTPPKGVGIRRCIVVQFKAFFSEAAEQDSTHRRHRLRYLDESEP